MRGCPVKMVSRGVLPKTYTSKGMITSTFVQIFASTGNLHLPHIHIGGARYQTTLIPDQYIARA
jgi:hypothetical protein